MGKKVIKIGLDLDGVIIDKPPFVPKRLLEWLVRSHTNQKLAYRYPTLAAERWLRWITHHPFFRPPIRKNVEFIKNLSKDSRYQLFIISGRYSFLGGRTRQWLRHYRLKDCFDGVFLNLANRQPHLFKERMIKKLGTEVFIDDDFAICEYLLSKTQTTKILYFDKERKQDMRQELLTVLY